MSRTNAHRPYRARFTRSRHPRERHDHRHGACDLPSVETWRQLLNQQRRHWLLRDRYRCSWELPPDELETLCGCALCTRQVERRQQRRRDRRAAARHLRDAVTSEHPHEPDGGPTPDGRTPDR
jgi:hypothetical protein